MLEEDVILQGVLEQIQSQKTQSNSKQWSMVTIRDSARTPTSTNSDCSVFPPVNHENLQISSHDNQQHPSSKSPSSSLSLSPPSDFGTRDLSSTSKEIVGWLDSGLQLLRTKIRSLFSLFTNDGASKGASWSFGPVAGVAVVVMWWWLCKRIRRRRSQRESVEHLKLIIKEKDEKILQLLRQIAQLNEVLVARHKVLASKLPN